MLKFDKRGGLARKEILSKLSELLEPEIEKIREVIKKKDYSDKRCTIILPDDKRYFSNVQKFAKKKAKNLDILVVIGIGGMHFGTIAVHEAINDKRYNQLTGVKPKVFFAETVDASGVSDIVQIVEYSLKKGEKVLLNICSKSGTTPETVVNAQVFLNLLQRYKKPFKDNVVVTTDFDSPLWKFAKENKIECLEIPKNISGKFSVLSAVGVFPLTILGVDCAKLLKGAKQMRNKCLGKFSKNPAAQSACHLFHHNKQGKNIHDTFIFSKELESLGKWYRQLMGESLGKRGKGITPTVSIGTSDLHSTAQLYLGGPNDKFTTFVTLKKDKKDVKIPFIKGFEPLAKAKTYSFMRDAIFKGAARAYQKRDRPYIHIELSGRDEQSIGEFLQLKMMETMFLAKLLDVNAFNQPNVEDYKLEVRRLLK